MCPRASMTSVRSGPSPVGTQRWVVEVGSTHVVALADLERAEDGLHAWRCPDST